MVTQTAPAAPSPVSMKALLEAGVHFGHQTHRWDPRMKPFIFTERNGIHILDLQQTVPLLKEAMSFVRALNVMLKDKIIGRRVVPIVVDESRTFGMEGLFRQIGIWNQDGQKYVPQDADQMMFYKETKDGQILQEGINEAGAMADWIAAGTAYSTHGVQMIPVYVCYSMFGMQRTLDLVWAAGDQRSRGFLIGGTAGRTTLNGEGLQHEDGHSHILSGTVPNCVSYDPTFAFEVAVIVQDGLRRMYAEQEDVFY